MMYPKIHVVFTLYLVSIIVQVTMMFQKIYAASMLCKSPW